MNGLNRRRQSDTPNQNICNGQSTRLSHTMLGLKMPPHLQALTIGDVQAAQALEREQAAESRTRAATQLCAPAQAQLPQVPQWRQQRYQLIAHVRPQLQCCPAQSGNPTAPKHCSNTSCNCSFHTNHHMRQLATKSDISLRPSQQIPCAFLDRSRSLLCM